MFAILCNNLSNDKDCLIFFLKKSIIEAFNVLRISYFGDFTGISNEKYDK